MAKSDYSVSALVSSRTSANEEEGCVSGYREEKDLESETSDTEETRIFVAAKPPSNPCHASIFMIIIVNTLVMLA